MTKLFSPRQTKLFLDHAFGTAWKNGVTDFNCLFYNTNSSWSLETYIPYGNDDCTLLTHKIIAKFTPTNFTQVAEISLDDLYVPKLQNLRKCPINIAVFPCEPYVSIKIQNGQRKLDGIEIKIIEAVADSLNFTPKYILPEDVYGNNSVYGMKEDCFNLVIIRIRFLF